MTIRATFHVHCEGSPLGRRCEATTYGVASGWPMGAALAAEVGQASRDYAAGSGWERRLVGGLERDLCPSCAAHYAELDRVLAAASLPGGAR